ncbi:DNA polymerase-3 subunit alpha [Pedobacter suwonensis]|uniref:DNA-directed DNA polymerase n=1 Tax=Pedobacter suwonensis TaxID=332999 RepID=A0A1I0U3Q0_9SPHI|nr:DNA polymerase III subunit alpha [Pedobacter suwonensis]SFA58523.1 DNA polymerase-3 subunit alpha [Pedobacter suwonensis]
MFLNCHSYHSLRYGTIPLDELVTEATKFGASTLALTDINTVTGIYDFVRQCNAVGIKPLVGMEFRRDNELLYIALAKNADGIAEMNRYLTNYNLEKAPLPDGAPAFNDCIVIYTLESKPTMLRENEYIGIRSDQLTKLYAQSGLGKFVVLHPITVRSKKEFNLHKILRAIDLNILGSLLKESDCCLPTEMFTTESGLIEKFSAFPEIIKNTEAVISCCNYEFDFETPKNRKFYTNDRLSDMQLLTSLAQHGFKTKYGNNNKVAKARLTKELKVIDQLEFSGYFLITWDIIRYSNSMGFMHVGRGSGANSIVAYCLGITAICPMELDLYFERFLNLNRKNPPDFDIDWSWQDRDTILEYIFTRYGRDYVAFCGTNVEFKHRSIYREIGKVFGLAKDELDKISSNANALNETSITRQIRAYGEMLRKFPNQRSMHSCGILISEKPITNYTTLEMPPKGFPIVQFDMHIAEEIGFEKFDILSQRGLGSIKDTVQLIKKNQGIKVDIEDTTLSLNEEKANEFLAIGRTIGCFYIESPAMRGLLRRLKCNDYKVLVAASSIIRPGVAQSGMMKEYIFRHNNPDKFEYFHDVFKEQLGETYGIMVYQEDVIKIALHYGGLPAEDGDVLRRAMSGKGRSLSALQRVKDHFFECCSQQGHPLKLSEEIYRQIESFAGYSFCKAHSASYAVESYQSLYLKVYYPIEFSVAVINNQGGFYRTEVYIHEARMMGANIHNPCVNRSDYQTNLNGKDIFLGFMHLQGLQLNVAEKIVADREENGDYLSLENFIKRVEVGIEGIQTLICIGAFRFTGKTKAELMIAARLLLINHKPSKNHLLIEEPIKNYTLPVLDRDPLEDAFDEIELLSFPTSCSPFEILQTDYRGEVFAKDLLQHHKKQIKMLAYLISTKHVPTKAGDMFFGTWIDVNGEYFDTAHFANSLKRFPFLGGGIYRFTGKVEVDFHFPTITVTEMYKEPFVADPRFSSSDKKFEVQNKLKPDVSMTNRKPYPQEHEIGLPRKSAFN